MTSASSLLCPICLIGPSTLYRTVDGVDYFACASCGSLFADPAFLAKAASGGAQAYGDAYWRTEQRAAFERCFGSSPIRVAETLLYCRRPVRRFLDIGAGAGYLLDALSELLPSAKSVFHGVDAFPPAPPHRSTHPNFTEGRVSDVAGPFDAGICVEVLEHLVPDALRALVRELAAVSAPGALYFFNSGQPEYVENEDSGYLDPTGRGHIASYSLAGARSIFEPAGFNIIRLPGRHWAFLAEFGPAVDVSRDELYARLWSPVPDNVALLKQDPFGHLLYSAGLDAARCYLELGAPKPPPPPPPDRSGLGHRLKAGLQRVLP